MAHIHFLQWVVKGMFPENKLLESSELFRLLFPADRGYQSQPPTESGLSCCHCAESIQHHRQLSSAPLMFMCICGKEAFIVRFLIFLLPPSHSQTQQGYRTFIFENAYRSDT